MIVGLFMSPSVDDAILPTAVDAGVNVISTMQHLHACLQVLAIRVLSTGSEDKLHCVTERSLEIVQTARRDVVAACA